MPKLTKLPIIVCKVCIAFASIYCLIGRLTGQGVHYTNYTVRHGLPSNKVYNITEDRNGFIWLATDRGASRFDGISFTNFSSDNGLPDNDVLKILEDSVGRIWFMNFATEPGYYFNGKIYNAGNDTFLSLLKKNKRNTPCIYAQDIATGQLYFRVPKGNTFVLISKDNNTQIDIGSYYGTEGISTIFMKKFGKKIMFIDGFRAFIKEKKGFTSINGPRRHLGGYEPQNERFYFSDVNGKIGWHNLITNTKEYYTDTGVLFSAFSMPQNTLYLLGKNELRMIYNHSIRSHILLGFEANGLTVTKNGNILFTSSDHGFYLVRKNFVRKIFGAENTTQSALSLCAVNDNLYIGTDGNGLIRYNGKGNLVKYDYPNGSMLRINGITTLDNSLLLATDIGLMELNNSSGIIKKDLPYSGKDIETGYRGEVLLATSGGIYLKEKGSKTSWQQLMYDRITTICCFNDSLLWYGRLQGLYYCSSYETRSPAKEYPFITHTPLDNSYIVDIKKDMFGNMWISTNQNGFFFYNPKCGFIAFNNRENNRGVAIASNICKKIFVDSNNTIWIANAAGLARVSYHIQNENPIFSIFNYTIADGLPDAGVNDVLVLNGQLIIATATGCYRFFPSTPTAISSRTLITNVTVNGSSYDPTTLLLSHNQNNLIFSFAASFIDAGIDKYHFKYLIKGLNTEWVHIHSTQIPLLGLAPGKYELLIATVGYNNQSGPITHFFFTIYKPWYKTTFFIIFSGLLFVLIAFFLLLREKRRIETSRNLAMMELKLLRSQMDPHFIFNSLNSIQQHLFKKDFKITNDYMSKFASLLRSNLHYSSLERITLEEELLFIKNYLDLEKYRFGNLFQYNITLLGVENTNDIKLPAFMVQPLLENAIKHGFANMKNGGWIELHFTILEEHLIKIDIADNGAGLAEGFQIKRSKKPTDSVGLSIVQQRIALLRKQKNNSRLLFEIKNREDAPGTVATLILPISTYE